MELFKLFGTIAIQDSEAKRSLKGVADSAQDTDRKLSGSFDNMEDSVDGLDDGLKKVKSTGETTGEKLASAMKKLGGMMVATFAVDKIKDFGVALVEASANAQAVNAQVEQVFGEAEGMARSAIKELGNEFGMLPSRLIAPFTQTTSMFKGLGMSVEDAMEASTLAVTLASDSAAFYDKSFEDANSSLGSFIKGNYEGGEQINLFANETRMASWASEELGLEWKNLGEADKQLARLKFAEKMMEGSGAIGQASRESDSLSNQMGNLKQAWQDFMGILGQPILEAVIPIIKNIGSFMADAGEATKGFMNMVRDGEDPLDALSITLAEVFGIDISPFTNAIKGSLEPFQPLIDKVKEFGSTFKENMDSGKGLAGSFKDTMMDTLGVDITPFTEGIRTFLTWVSPVITEVQEFWVSLKDTVLGFATDVGVSLGNFYLEHIKPMVDRFREAFGGSGNEVTSFRDTIQTIVSRITEFIQNMSDTIGDIFDKMGEGVEWVMDNILGPVVDWIGDHADEMRVAFDTVMESIQNLFSFNTQPFKDALTQFFQAIQPLVDTLKESWEFLRDAIVDFAISIADTLTGFYNNHIKPFVDRFKEVFMSGEGSVTSFRDTIDSVVNAIVPVVEEVAKAIGQFFRDLAEIVGWLVDNVLGPIVDFVADHLDEIKAIFQNVFDAIKNIFDLFGAIFRGDWSRVWEEVRAIADNIWNIIKNAFQIVWDAITGIFNTALSLIQTGLSNAWNTIKETASRVWNGIKQFFSDTWESIKTTALTVWDSIKSSISTAWENIRATATRTWNNIKDAVLNPIRGARDGVKQTVDNIKSNLSSSFDSIKSTVTRTWNNIKNAITGPIDKARDAVGKAISKIKDFFNIDLKFPKIKMPHFKIEGGFSLMPPSVPKLAIDWYAEGGILTKPTLFGFDPFRGRAMVGGESGHEAIAPIDKLMGYTRQAVAEQMGPVDALLSQLIDMWGDFMPEALEALRKPVMLDSGAIVGGIGLQMDNRLGEIRKLKERGA